MRKSFKQRSNRFQRQNDTQTHINIAPLVDVMLVLLVIFMVTAPMLTVGVPVDLPKTKAAKMAESQNPITVSINHLGQVFLQETQIRPIDLPKRLYAIAKNNMDAQIFVRGDQKLAYGRIMQTMGIIAEAGFKKVSLIAEVPSKPVHRTR